MNIIITNISKEDYDNFINFLDILNIDKNSIVNLNCLENSVRIKDNVLLGTQSLEFYLEFKIYKQYIFISFKNLLRKYKIKRLK